MKFLTWLFVCVLVVGFAACGGRKPAYSDINLNQSRASNENGSVAVAPESPPVNAPPIGLPSNTSPQPALPPVQIPSFMDPVKGEAKDLPKYPGGVVVSIQYGPRENLETLSMALRTSDPMERIADYYDKAIKSNGWTVVDTTRDPEISNWDLKKGDKSEGKVEIRKDPQSGGMVIVIVRIDKKAEQKVG
jgi:hypothetical protein